MRILFYLIYIPIFLALAIGAMFFGGVSGVAGTLYLMVEPGDMQTNITQALSVLTLVWLLILLLRQQNIKVMKRNKRLKLEAEEKNQVDNSDQD